MIANLIAKNQMEKKWNMKGKLNLHGGFWGLCSAEARLFAKMKPFVILVQL